MGKKLNSKQFWDLSTLFDPKTVPKSYWTDTLWLFQLAFSPAFGRLESYSLQAFYHIHVSICTFFFILSYLIYSLFFHLILSISFYCILTYQFHFILFSIYLFYFISFYCILFYLFDFYFIILFYFIYFILFYFILFYPILSYSYAVANLNCA